MKIFKNLLFSFVIVLITFSCFEDNDDNAIYASEINDFVWKGMNVVYLYKDNIPDLANDRFATDSEYADYLSSFEAPEEIFESLIYQRTIVDRFSWIVDDYIALEELFNGISVRSGYEFNLYPVPGSSTDSFGVVRLVLPNSSASDNNLERGQVFTTIDGTTLTEANYRSLFSPNSYTLGLADYDDNGTPNNLDDDIITSNGQNKTLTKTTLSENPIFKTDIINVGGENLGYLMYNGFTSNFDNQLNTVFGNFKANNVLHLVLDLRYNPGGSVLSASYLGSMITGQFNGELFARLVYNSELQSNNNDYEFTSQINNASINSLNLDKIYVLTTEDSASASEMIINSLSPYIEVIQIGDNTTGKSQASITVYDSQNLQREGANPNHTYAMQPLVANTLNKLNNSVPSIGLTPSTGFRLLENPSNLGVLGNVNEPLLAAAISDILGTGRYNVSLRNQISPTASSNSLIPHVNEMYINEDAFFDILTKRVQQE